MQGILDLINEGQPTMQPAAQPQAPKPDEVAQIVVQAVHGQGIILRFKTEKKAIAAYKRLQIECKKWPAKEDRNIVNVESDMFETTLDMSEVAFFSLVIHKVAKKFVPIP